MGCTCPEPGWCERHKMHKTPHLHRLCQTRPAYFAAWERGDGPGQRIVPAEPPRMGLGDMVAAGLSLVGITESRYKRFKQRLGLSPGCGCSRRRRALNRLGRKLGIGR